MDTMDSIPQNSNIVQCPCWSNTSNRCAISDGGVYVPLPQHVLMFCQSSCYVQCSHYINGMKLILKRDYIDRRVERRFKKNVPVHISIHNEYDDKLLTKKYKVQTIDVNCYGMKLESDCEITANTLVDFEINNDIQSHPVEGKGVVKWCERQMGSKNFEFGVAFSKDTAIQQRIEKILCS